MIAKKCDVCLLSFHPDKGVNAVTESGRSIFICTACDESLAWTYETV